MIESLPTPTKDVNNPIVERQNGAVEAADPVIFTWHQGVFDILWGVFPGTEGGKTRVVPRVSRGMMGTLSARGVSRC